LTELLSNEQVSSVNKRLSYGLSDWRTRVVFLANQEIFRSCSQNRLRPIQPSIKSVQWNICRG